jgi:hypothetical protein
MNLFDLESLRKDVEKFNSETNLEYYLNWSGQKDELNLSKIYDKYARLLDIENVVNIKELRNKEERRGNDERRLRYLQAFVIEGLLGQKVKEYTDKAETVTAKKNIKVGTEVIPYRLAEVRYHNEDDREKRAKIFQARDRVIEEELNPLLEERMEKLHGIAGELGYDNYIELFRDAKSIDFGNLDNAMTYFNERTESLYLDRMGEQVKKTVGVALNEAEKHDIAYIFRAKEFDSYFTKEKTLTVLKRTLDGMGFDIAKNKNVSIDLEERPKKNPRAFTALVRIPNDVRLVVMPKGGQDDYTSILHEAGHTLHFALVNPMLPVEYKWLGDLSVSETYAFLFEYLTLNRIWLDENIRIKDLDKYLDFAYIYKLYYLRRYTGKLKYELLLHKSKRIKDMSEKYKEELDHSLTFKNPESHYLTDTDDGFYSAQYLRAWIFEAQLRSRMIEKFGDKWFRNPQAGDFLAELWSNGQKFDVVELAQRIGFKGLDVKPILAEITEHLA